MKKNSLEMHLKPEWDEIENVRNEANEFLSTFGCGDDAIHAVSMVSSELVENAVKYGHYDDRGIAIRYTLEIDGGAIIVEVRSPLGSTSEENLRRLDETIQWIRGYQSPFEAYVEKLKELSTGERKEGESGLGLVRIAYEGQSILDFYVDEHNMLAMSAVYRM
jgi:hypothetical protein